MFENKLFMYLVYIQSDSEFRVQISSGSKKNQKQNAIT